MLAPTGASNRKPLPLGMGYITSKDTSMDGMMLAINKYLKFGQAA